MLAVDIGPWIVKPGETFEIPVNVPYEEGKPSNIYTAIYGSYDTPDGRRFNTEWLHGHQEPIGINAPKKTE